MVKNTAIVCLAFLFFSSTGAVFYQRHRQQVVADELIGMLKEYHKERLVKVNLETREREVIAMFTGRATSIDTRQPLGTLPCEVLAAVLSNMSYGMDFYCEEVKYEKEKEEENQTTQET